MRYSDFDLYKDLLKEKSGLSLTPDKSYLLDSRLGPVARKWHYPSIGAMTIALRGIPDPGLITDIVGAMAGEESSFFRDIDPFTLFRNKIMPYMVGARREQKKCRIWSTGCAAGQEPYSLAMIIHDMALSKFSADIIGTDVSGNMLDMAVRGEYTTADVQRGMPVRFLLEYFDQHDDIWVLKNTIRSMVRFHYANVLESNAHLGNFDVIFCRYLMMTFDKETKRKVLRLMAAQLAEDGFLVLGKADTPAPLPEELTALPGSPGLYVKTNGPHDIVAAG